MNESPEGYITRIRPSRQTPVPIIDRIPEALQQWQNLHTVTLTPQRATAGRALHNIVKALRHCPSLRSVTVNDYAMDNDIMPDLAELTGLRELTLLHPTGALFLEIFSWLTRLQDTLVVLHLLASVSPWLHQSPSYWHCFRFSTGELRIIDPWYTTQDHTSPIKHSKSGPWTLILTRRLGHIHLLSTLV